MLIETPWNAITYVSSGLTLIAFVTACGVWIYRRHILGTERRIQLAPEAERAVLVEQTLEFFRVDTSRLSRQQQYEIALRQIDARAAKFRLTAILIFALAIITAMVALYAGTDRVDGQVVASGTLRLERVTPDNMRIARMTWKEFTVRAVDVRGRPVTGVKIVWQTPAGGSKIYVCQTDDAGVCSATNLYTFSNAGVYTQLATVAVPDTPLGFSDADAVRTLGPSITFNFAMQ